MSSNETEAKPAKRRKLFFWIAGAFLLFSLFCLCSGLALAWTYGDSIIEALNITF